MLHYDLVIVGGGLVGASFARAISGAGFSTLLIDRIAAAESYSAALDNRGLAISYTTKQILKNLQVWSELEAQAYPITTVHVSEIGSFGFTKLTAASWNVPALGYVISASNLGRAIVHGLEALPDIHVMRPVEITNLQFDTANTIWTIDVNNTQITTKLLIAADGSNSLVLKKQQVTTHVKNYNQSAIVTNIGIEQKNITTAFERFTAEGVLALLPFGAQQVKCVWTVDDDKLAMFKEMSSAQFLAKLQATIGFRLGKLTSVSERKIFPVIHSYAQEVHRDGLVLLGNSANTLHPVAAQGFNLGMRDVVALTNILRKGESLQKYADMRKADHERTRSFSNNLVAVFAHDMPLVKISRKFGLLAAQFIPFFNKKIISQGLGVWM